MRNPVATLVSLALVTLAVASCNAILGNEEALPYPSSSALDRCAVGEKECLGVCVGALSPLFGCGTGTCDACALTKTDGYTCDGNGCNVTSCLAAYANCDERRETGCETDLRRPESCGSCDKKCDPTDKKFCDSSSGDVGKFTCVEKCEGSQPCGNQCVNPNSDIANCGACGKECPAPTGSIPKCEAGECRIDCAPGFRLCSGKCERETALTCGTKCETCAVSDPNRYNAACVAGACVEVCKFAICDGQCKPPPCVPTCGANQGICATGGPCINLDTPAHCGSCAPCTPPLTGQTVTCEANAQGAHVCVYRCAPGLTNCSGVCAQLDSDPSHCGSCTTNCHSDGCAVGVCGGTCIAGYGNCDANMSVGGCEVPLTSTPNCGACGRNCHAPCSAGVCTVAPCEAPWKNCDTQVQNGCETNTDTSRTHCGDCNRTCAGTCVGGACVNLDGGTDADADAGDARADGAGG